MKIKDGFVLREVSGNYLVVAVGEGTKTFNGMIQLNDTGALLFKELQKGATEQELVDAMMKEYNVSKEDATNDVLDFINGLKEANLLK